MLRAASGLTAPRLGAVNGYVLIIETLKADCNFALDLSAAQPVPSQLGREKLPTVCRDEGSPLPVCGPAVLRHPPQRGGDLPATPLPKTTAKAISALRARQGNQTFLRSAAPGARKAMEKAPCSSRCSLPPASGWPDGHFSHTLHLPPSMAWAMAKACLEANTAQPFKNRRNHP
jgi:hypothetical protein